MSSSLDTCWYHCTNVNLLCVAYECLFMGNFRLAVLNTIIRENDPRITVLRNFGKQKCWTRELHQETNHRNKLFKRRQGIFGIFGNIWLRGINSMNSIERLHKEYIEGVQRNIASNPAEFGRNARLNAKSSTYPNEMHLNGNLAATPEKGWIPSSSFMHRTATTSRQISLKYNLISHVHRVWQFNFRASLERFMEKTRNIIPF